MGETLLDVLIYATVPLLAMVAASGIALLRSPGQRLVSGFQHFAAGVVFAAVAVELLPGLHQIDSPLAMVAGFLAGIAVMLAGKRAFESAGTFVPLAVDLFIDGLLLAIGFASGAEGGAVLLAGLTLETLSLGLSTTPIVAKRGSGKMTVVGIMATIGLTIILGSAVGHALAGSSTAVFAAVLGFGVSALLYLVTEELLAEAHGVPDTPIVTATFFAGFLVPLLMAMI